MPGNWDPVQPLIGGRVEWPTGPIEDLDEQIHQPRWVQAWVVQGDLDPEGDENIYPGSSQSSGQSYHWKNNRWTAAEAGWVNGALQEGPAVGIAILALHNDADGTFEFEWWHEVVHLEEQH